MTTTAASEHVDDDDLDWVDSPEPIATAWTTTTTTLRSKRTYGNYSSRHSNKHKLMQEQQQPTKRTSSSSFTLPEDHCIVEHETEEEEDNDDYSNNNSHSSWTSSNYEFGRTSTSTGFGSDAEAATAALNLSSHAVSSTANTSSTTEASSSFASSSKNRIPPLRPSKKQHKRSLSMSMPPKIPRPQPITRSSTNSHSSATSSIKSVLHGFDEENAHPNSDVLNDIGERPSPPPLGRRKVRARRASTSGSNHTMPSSTGFLRRGNSVPVIHPSQSMNNFIRSPSPVVMSRRNSMPNLDDTEDGLAWLSQHTAASGASGDPRAPSHAASVMMCSPPTARGNILGRFDSGDLTDTTTGNSPSGFSTTSVSSRKRGMSEEPNENDDMSVSGAFTAPRTSLKSNSASRACRIMSPGFGASRQSPTFTSANLDYTDVTIIQDNAFKSTGRATTLSDSDEGGDSDDDYSDASSMQQEDEIESDTSPLKDSTIKPVKTKEDVIDTMPSYPDLKHLTRELERLQNLHKKALKKAQVKFEKEPRLLQQFTDSFNKQPYQIKPREDWPTERRAAFLRWASKGLGLTLHTSQSVSYLQTLPAKGNALHSLLYSAIVHQKRQELSGVARDVSSQQQNGPFVLDTSSDVRDKSNRAIQTFAETHSATADPASMDLIEGMSAMSFSNTIAAKKEPEPPLVRIVTVDPSHRPPESSKLQSSKVNFDAMSPLAVGRPSMENQFDVDFNNLHMHGASPSPAFHRHSNCRPSRFPRPSFGSVSTVASTSESVRMVGVNTTANGTSSCMSTSSHQFDFVGTPMMTPLTQHKQNWGSRPIPGKDWGESEQCPERVVTANIRSLNEALEEAGLYDAKEETEFDFKSIPERRSADLCLDLEAEDSCDEENTEDEADYFGDRDSPMKTKNRRSFFNALEEIPSAEKLRHIRRQNVSFAKHRRMSVCVSSNASGIYDRKSLFAKSRQSYNPVAETKSLAESMESFHISADDQEAIGVEQPLMETLVKKNILPQILTYLEGPELLSSASLVCQSWADAATDAYAELMLASVGCAQSDNKRRDDDDDSVISNDEFDTDRDAAENSVALSMQRSWNYLMTNFPYASYLSEGAFKRVYKVKNAAMNAPEAVSIMDVDKIEATGNQSVVATELAVSIMLSSLSRRGICPNFVVTRGVFTCPFEPPASHWGSADNKNHHVFVKSPDAKRRPKQPASKYQGRFQYIRMELCTEGDAEEFIKDQPNELLNVDMSRILLFQISFALYAAASRFSLKHYDLKLLNVFLQGASNVPGADISATGDVVLRYGLGSKNFALKMPVENALLAKVADYGTACVKAESNGRPLSLAQITTPENTPPDFLILGDAAKQGHEHDLFGLGLCMLHLFTGKAPYEEILEDVRCPPNFKKMLQAIWEDVTVLGYSVVRSFVLADVYMDDEGNITEGEPDDTFYDTLYRFLVLFGIPENKFQKRQHGKVWKAINDCLHSSASKRGKDVVQFARDQKRYSLSHGTNKYIARARQNLENTEGAMELLRSLVEFDPARRATALDVLNSRFFASLIEAPGTRYQQCDDVRSFKAFATM